MTKAVNDWQTILKKIAVRVSIPLLVVALWVLGDVKRSYWIKDSPDGRFSTRLVADCGWNTIYINSWFPVYVTDNKTGETVLATTHPAFCVWEQIALYDIKWERDNRRFICLWTVQNNGVNQQYFRIETEPLRVKASPPCCGVE